MHSKNLTELPELKIFWNEIFIIILLYETKFFRFNRWIKKQQLC